MTNTEQTRFNTLFDNLVKISHTKTSQFQQEVNLIQGSSLNYKSYNGKYGMYETKSGKTTKAFYCPGKFRGCPFSSNKATNIKRHLCSKEGAPACKYILDTPVKNQVIKMKKIAIDKVKLNLNDEEGRRLLTVLAGKMEKVMRSSTYDGQSTSWQSIDDRGTHHTRYGIATSPIILLVNWFKTWFLKQSAAWGPSKLMRSYDRENKGCRFMDKGLCFYYVDEEEKWVKLQREEALRFLVVQFRPTFLKAYECMATFNRESLYYWHEVLFDVKHPTEIAETERELEYDALDDFDWSMRLYYEEKKKNARVKKVLEEAKEREELIKTN